MPINDWSFLGAVATILLTPGPTNTLLATAGIGIGWRRSLALLPFETLGYVLATTLWGWALNALVGDHPQLLNLIQLLAGVYIGLLAWRLWRQAALDRAAPNACVVRGRQLFMATLLNPKAVVFGTALLPAQTWDSLTNYGTVLGSFVVLVAGIGSLWIAFGAALLSGRIRWLSPSRFQHLAALVLLGFAVWLLWIAVSG